MKESVVKYSCPTTPFDYWFQDTPRPMQMLLRTIVRILTMIIKTVLTKGSQMSHNLILVLFFLASQLHWWSSLSYKIGTGFVYNLSICPGGSRGKESACNAGDPGWGRSPGEGNGNPLQHSCLENSMDRGAWRAAVHGVAGSDTAAWLTLHLSDIYSPIL